MDIGTVYQALDSMSHGDVEKLARGEAPDWWQEESVSWRWVRAAREALSLENVKEVNARAYGPMQTAAGGKNVVVVLDAGMLPMAARKRLPDAVAEVVSDEEAPDGADGTGSGE